MRFWPLLLLVSLPASAQTASPRIVLQTSTILDGRGAILKNQQIVIEGSGIVSVSGGTAKPTYDLRGLTVMPGWIDTHVHINWHMNEDNKSVAQSNKLDDAALYTAADAWMTLMGGFTTVQSVGASSDAPVRNFISRGLLPGPRILTSIRQITNQSGDPDALRALVRKTKEEGGDVIKLFATTGLGAGGNKSMTDEQIQAVCGEAKAIGLRVVVHAIGDEGARAAVLAGCTSIEHGTFLKDDTLDLMAQRGTYFDPNLLVLHNYLDKRESFAFPEQALNTLQKGIPPTEDVLRRARAPRESDLRNRRRRRCPRPQRRGVRLPRSRRSRQADGRDRQRDVFVGGVARNGRSDRKRRSRFRSGPRGHRGQSHRRHYRRPSCCFCNESRKDL